MRTVILRTTARALTPLVVALSIFMLLRGHDAPGGGFIGGLIAGAAVVLQYVGQGPERRTLLRVRFDTLLAMGLLIAVGIGIVALLFGGHFLEGTVWEQHLPVIGELKIASSFGFDVGVFLVVLSAVIAILRSLGEREE
ncbi:MAG: Na(+)/H(+) antiporter subunit B [Actinomycetota bacterium]|nr:Na(+)/H(+) antiporter subunit B [Actinomycetota bacterium]